MRLLITLTIFCLVCYVSCKNTNVKSLTESMGQEVIEIGAPIKGLNELPSDIDEEPSAEDDEDDTTTTTTTTATTIAPATKKEIPPIITEGRRRGSKDIDMIDDREDEDARIEKELAEIYKDNFDYKAETTETTRLSTTEKKTTPTPATPTTPPATTTMDNIVFKTYKEPAFDEDKPIARSKNNFKFQPDATDQASIERWRTSIDDITCDKASTSRMAYEEKPKSTNSTTRITLNILLLLASYYTLSAYG